jgi:signal transduction histidine kinase
MPHVLIVDDDAALLQALPEALRLRMPGVTVDTCDSATAALFRIASTDYDAVVSDIKMPGMDGLALLAEIRALRPDTPTLLITGHGEHDLAVQALRGGAYDFIQKPIDRDYFVASLARAIRMRQLARQVEEQTQALELHATELEQIVEERTRELREANQAKDHFLAVLSHELRTPLTPIQACVELLRQGAGEPERVRRAADIIERNVRLQTSLVNDLLDLSRITRGKLRLERRPVPLVELISQTLDGLRAEADAAGIALVWELPETELHAEVDPLRMQQIVLNLVSNAIKYTPSGGRVSLELAIAGTERRGDTATVGSSRAPLTPSPPHPVVRLTVADTGVGIAPEALPQIFEMFHQEADPGRRGLGIGLALVQSLARMHGGRVWAESEGPGRGSRFIVELAALPAAPKAAPAPPESSWNGHRAPEVLLVEDSRDSREMLAEVLSLLGYQTRGAASADEALALLAGWRPDIILSDIGLPRVDGYELIRRIRRLPELTGVVALAVTGYGTGDDREQALAAGFDGHLTKPLDVAALDRQLRDLLPVSPPVA